MKKISIFLLLTCLAYGAGARNLWAYLTYATFNSPEGPYIETYLSVDASSIKFIKKDNGNFQATVNILFLFKQGKEIKAFKKYELNSREEADTSKLNSFIIDEQRFQVPNGTYDFEIQISDKNKDVKPVPYTQSVTVDFPENKPCLSGIQLVKSYKQSDQVTRITKSGYDLVPYVYSFYPKTEAALTFYCELYNIDKTAGKGEPYLLSYYIETYETNMKLNEYTRIKKETANPVDVVLTEFDINNLATGNYNLVVEARNRQNELIASKKLFFQRSNPDAKPVFTDFSGDEPTNTFAEKMTNIDTLREFISSTFPISTGIEQAFLRESLKKADLHSLQQYFYGFWHRRDAAAPEKAWLAYREQVKKADYNFHTPVKKGYQTDRGYVFLKYGAPNARSKQYSEPCTYPYEIWQYYVLNETQRNRKFVFYSPDMVTSDFFLLHSDAIGEVYNAAWRIALQGRCVAPNNVDDTQVVNTWGTFVDQTWDLPN